MNQLTDTFSLYNGYKIPCVGFGTWQAPDGAVTENALRAAIEAGYRHIDTAAAYRNEACIGRTLKKMGVPRSELFITSKLWVTERGYPRVKKAFEKTLADLKLDYLDLYLIHWPASQNRYENWETINKETWQAMMELYHAGLIRAIGVSNFLPHHLAALMETELPPMVNQIEFHPGQTQDEVVQFCREHHILVQAWSPLGTGRLLSNPRLQEIAAKYGKSVAQLCIRWCLQNGVLPLPKSVTPSRIVENTKIFDFTITDEDMALINSMPYMGGSGLHPDHTRF